MNKGYKIYFAICIASVVFGVIVYVIVKLFRLLGGVADKIEYGGDDI